MSTRPRKEWSVVGRVLAQLSQIRVAVMAADAAVPTAKRLVTTDGDDGLMVTPAPAFVPAARGGA